MYKNLSQPLTACGNTPIERKQTRRRGREPLAVYSPLTSPENNILTRRSFSTIKPVHFLPPSKPPRLLFVKRNAVNLMWFSVSCLVDYKKTLWFYIWLYITDSKRHQLLHTLTGRLTQASTSKDLVVKSLLFWGNFVINCRISCSECVTFE